jgi:hypothetical protein
MSPQYADSSDIGEERQYKVRVRGPPQIDEIVCLVSRLIRRSSPRWRAGPIRRCASANRSVTCHISIQSMAHWTER